MPLQKRWESLDRRVVGKAPNRYGVVEFGDGSGTVLAIETGVLRDVLKEAVAYGDYAQVRWQAAQDRAHADRLADEHRDRL
ncbi:DUF7508 domain-containing protein [Halorarius litoreus]|uniref:DUF7508 domain-containing protein n=1 Tax=Halorarius litoreus TaxID=2962676 RepID=UPI0020CCE12D|nr:hypothetical protein [Halorarius litoreus]